jgi:hypothetical protein
MKTRSTVELVNRFQEDLKIGGAQPCTRSGTSSMTTSPRPYGPAGLSARGRRFHSAAVFASEQKGARPELEDPDGQVAVRLRYALPLFDGYLGLNRLGLAVFVLG